MKRIPVSYSAAYKEAIKDTLEELSGIAYENLSEEQRANFDFEVQTFYNNVPRWWLKKPVQSNMKPFEKHHGTWLNHLIRIEPALDEQLVNNLCIYLSNLFLCTSKN